MSDPIEQARLRLAAEAEQAENQRLARLDEKGRERDELSVAQVAGYRDVLAAAPQHITVAPIPVFAGTGVCQRLPSAFETLGNAHSARGDPSIKYGCCDAWVFTYIRRGGMCWVAVAADGTAAFAPENYFQQVYFASRFPRRARRVRSLGWYVDIAAGRAEGTSDSPGWDELARLIAGSSPCEDSWV